MVRLFLHSDQSASTQSPALKRASSSAKPNIVNRGRSVSALRNSSTSGTGATRAKSNGATDASRRIVARSVSKEEANTTIGRNSSQSKTSRSALTSIVKKPKRAIIHPLLSEAACTVDDPFWVNILERAAMGNMLSKFSYHGGVLSYEKGGARSNKRSERTILSDEPRQAAKQFIAFAQVQASIYSDKDMELAHREQVDQRGGQVIEQWRDIKKKMTRRVIVNRYIRTNLDRFGLTGKRAEHAAKLVRRAVLETPLSSDDFILDGLTLVAIARIHWSSEGVEVDFEPQPIKPAEGTPYIRNFSAYRKLRCNTECARALKEETSLITKHENSALRLERAERKLQPQLTAG